MKSIYSREYSYFIDCMLEARHKAGLTQAQLAKKLGKPQSFVAKYENGERRLDVVEFITISRALEIDARKVFNSVLRLIRADRKARGKMRGAGSSV